MPRCTTQTPTQKGIRNELVDARLCVRARRLSDRKFRQNRHPRRTQQPRYCTALHTAVVLVFAWAIVFATGEHTLIRALKGRSLLFLALSGVGTGGSWLCYFGALQMAPASRVAAIDVRAATR
jgi:drug/metabolite transporter (DMT)-like permease